MLQQLDDDVVGVNYPRTIYAWFSIISSGSPKRKKKIEQKKSWIVNLWRLDLAKKNYEDLVMLDPPARRVSHRTGIYITKI